MKFTHDIKKLEKGAVRAQAYLFFIQFPQVKGSVL